MVDVDVKERCHLKWARIHDKSRDLKKLSLLFVLEGQFFLSPIKGGRFCHFFSSVVP